MKSREGERVETDLRRQARVSCLQSVKMPGVLTSALRREVGGFKGFLKVEEKGEGGRRKREREQSLSRKTPRKLRSDDDDEAFLQNEKEAGTRENTTVIERKEDYPKYRLFRKNDAFAQTPCVRSPSLSKP